MTENKDSYIHPSLKEMTKKLIGVMSDRDEDIIIGSAWRETPIRKWEMSHRSCLNCFDIPCKCRRWKRND